MIATADRIDFRSTIDNLPALSVEELSQLKLWCDEKISLIKGQIDAAKLVEDYDKTDWWRRVNSYVRKLGHLSQAIQEQRSIRKASLAEHPDVQFLAYLKRAMRAVLTQEQCDQIMAVAVQIQKGDSA